MKLRLLAVALVLCVGCGKSSPTTPTPPVQAPQPITLTVHVTATNGGQALSGVAGDVGGVTATTNADGGAQYQLPPGAARQLTLSGSGIVPRSLTIAVGASREVSVDAIATNGFDLNFYRQLVRNGFEQPATLQPLRRLPNPPQIYLKTVDDAGAPIDARTLESTARTVIDTAALWTGGRFGVAGLERGTGTKQGQPGWLTIQWTMEVGFCGSSEVGRDGGVISLNHKAGSGCKCAGVSEIRPRTVRHELGHAFGYWHTDSPSDLMSGAGALGCDLLPSARERAAAAIAYARPIGNLDPDVDPSTAVSLAPMTAR